MLNNASFTLSVVGLVPIPGTALSGRPFASPAITLKCVLPLSLSCQMTSDIVT